MSATQKIFYYSILIFILSFGTRVVVSTIYVHRFDTYERTDRSADANPPKKVHAMIKGDAEAVYYRPANVIIQQVRSGRNFFLAGGWNIGGFLYPRLIGLYGLVSGKIRLNPDSTIPTKQIYGFLIIQSLFFSLWLVLFFASLSKVVGVRIGTLTALFLSLEPTLVQYSSMMMTEALFIALLLLAISVWVATLEVRLEKEQIRFIVVYTLSGIILGIIFLQRTIAIIFPAVFIIGIYAQNKWRMTKSFLIASTLLIIPYILILVLVGVHNYYRAGFFYIVPVHGAYGWQAYLGNYVMAEVGQSTPTEARLELNKEALLRGKQEGLVRQEVTEEELTEYEFYRLSYIKQDQAKDIFLEHPSITLRFAVRNTLKSLNIDPLFTYRRFDNVYKPESAELRALQDAQHARDIPLRIAYSLLILVPAFLGWLFWRKVLPMPLNVLLTLLVLYFPAVSGWMGSNRYNVPNLAFYSVYWAISVERLIPWLRRGKAWCLLIRSP